MKKACNQASAIFITSPNLDLKSQRLHSECKYLSFKVNIFQLFWANIHFTDISEEETDRYRTPTKHNIRMAMHWLIQGCQPGDSLVFHFSGHGSQQRNYTGDEIDGFDETLCPLDFETQGMIVDDEINATIVKPLPHGVRLHAIIDACHSGTMLDLPFLCRMDRSGRYVWEDHSPLSGIFKGTNGGEVISFSGCDDDQSSADTAVISNALFILNLEVAISTHLRVNGSNLGCI